MRSAGMRNRAQSLLEFAIVLPLFLLLLLAMIDFSRLLFSYISLTNGTRELARSVAITSTSMNTVASAFNNLTIIGGPFSPATNVTLAPASGGGSGSISCSNAADAMCTIQVTTGSSSTSGCATGKVCLTNVTGATGSATYTSSPFNYSFNPTGSGDFVMLTWLAPDQYGAQQGYIQVCRLQFTANCVFPSASGWSRSQNTDGLVQVDARYTFQFNPLFQTRLDGIIDVSFMRPSSLLSTTVRTYAE
jgi:Flp pilus assembly protein TadG